MAELFEIENAEAPMGNVSIDTTNRAPGTEATLVPENKIGIDVTGGRDLIPVDVLPDWNNESQDVQTLIIQGKRQNYIVEDNVKSRLGGGNQANVYMCVGEKDSCSYALKIYNPNLIYLDKLQTILKFLITSNHPHIANIIEHGTWEHENRTYYYAVTDLYSNVDRMPYCWARSDNTVYRERILDFVEQMNLALGYIHSKGFFHGDIKPDNIMMNAETEQFVLIDFGGATKAEAHGHTATGAATTATYAAPETVHTKGKVNAFSDYYSFGVSLAEYLCGVYPGLQGEIAKRFDYVKAINFFRVPGDLPKHYLNLLRGLLYGGDSSDEIKSYRWTTQKVQEWLDYMRRGEFEQAGKCNRVPEMGIITVAKESEESPLGFESTLVLEIAGENMIFRDLVELADAFAEHWDEGYRYMKEEVEVFGSIKADIRKLIKKASDRMHDVNINKGYTANAEYFKFLYQYISDKEKFRWKTLPNVKNKKAFGEELHSMLESTKQLNYDFGDWWDDIAKRDYSDASKIIEIFCNKILSFYLKKSGEKDNRLLEQCSKVEQIFQEPKQSYSTEEVAEIYQLAYLLLGITSYETETGMVYTDYPSFLSDFKKAAYDPDKASEAVKLMKEIKNGNGFTPNFLAWKKMQEG